MMNKLIILLILASGTVNANEYLSYVAVDPCRIVDTREGRGVIPAGEFRTFRVSGTLGELAVQGGTECPNPMPGVQPDAVSAYVLVVPDKGTDGVATAYPSDKLPPPVGAGSTVNFSRGQVTGNTTNITLCTTTRMPVWNCPPSGAFAVLARNTGFNLVVDVQGYFYPTPVTGEGACPASSPVRYVDNGDETICDNQTGLMWEKKLAADGSDGGNCTATQNERNVHCVNNFYVIDYFVHDPRPLTSKTIFLATLNQDIMEVHDDSNNTCFANHCDWRIPRLSELKTIFMEGKDTIPCIDPIFNPIGYVLTTNQEGSSYGTSTIHIEEGFTVAYTVSFGHLDFNSQLCSYVVSSGCGGEMPCGGWVRAVRNTR